MSSNQNRVDREKGKTIQKSTSRGGGGRLPRRSRGGVVIRERVNEEYYEDDFDHVAPDFDQIEADRELAQHLAAQDRQESLDFNDDMDEQDDGGLATDSTNMPPPKKGKTVKSEVFTVYFRKVKLPHVEGQEPVVMAYCNFCDTKYEYKSGNGYGTYRRHILKHKPKQVDGQTNESMQAQLNFKQGTSELSLFKYNDVVAREVMAKFCSTEALAFQFADSMRFENTMKKAYNPQAKRIPRTSMTRTIYRLSVKYKIGLRDMFDKLPYRVSICSDIWSCAWQRNSYLGITVHWIDPNWCLNKRVLCFRKFNCVHNAANIALCIVKVLNQFKLTNKIFSIGFDNASANTASVPALIAACNPTLGGKYFHTRCICHILNLCVQDGLKLLEASISPIRKCVEMLRDKAKLGRAWLKFCKQRTGKSKKFNIDVCTRWNSTYEMLSTTYEFKDLLCEFFQSEVSNMFLLSSYWDECTDLLKLLEIFKTATKDLSGVYYPTASRMLYHCVLIVLQFNICSANPNLQDCINMMVIKWLKYFTYIPDVFLIAKCLDPSMKFEGVSGLLELYYGYLREMQFGGEVGSECFELPSFTSVQTSLDASLRGLFNEYETKHEGASSSRPSQRPKARFNLGIDSTNAAAQRLQNFLQNRGAGSSSVDNELDAYLKEPKSTDLTGEGPNDVDILAWWSMRQNQYPVLAMMAREILAVPASTVSVEQAFSVGGYVFDERRSMMTAQNLEAQILLKDYTLAEAREQENNWNELFADNPISTTEVDTDTDSHTTDNNDEFEDDWDFDNM